jgi:ubiquinone/menaquinone biosynthesis C-methylase UbiE
MEGGFGKAYSQFGVTKYYENAGQQYSNPHRYDIERLIKKKLSPNNIFIRITDKILDLACGSGEVTLPLRQMGYKNIEGIDPYTHMKYE